MPQAITVLKHLYLITLRENKAWRKRGREEEEEIGGAARERRWGRWTDQNDGEGKRQSNAAKKVV